MAEIIYKILDVAVGIAFAILIFNLPKVFETGYFDEEEKETKKSS